MRIGLVTPVWPGNLSPNGISTTVTFLVEGLEALGHAVVVIPLQQNGEEDLRCVDLPEARAMRLVERIVSKLGVGDPWQTVLAERIAAAAQTAVERHGIEVLVMEETQGWAGVVQHALSIPVIMTLHGPWFLHRDVQDGGNKFLNRQRDLRERTALRDCAGITSPSSDVLERTRSHYVDLAPIQAVIPNPIRVKQAVDFETITGNKRRSVLFVGRFDYHKGGDTVLHAFAELIAQGTDAYLTFVGPDPGVRKGNKGRPVPIEDALTELHPVVRERVTYLGPRTKVDIDTLRLEHLVTLIASRYENFPYTLLEALASGSAAVSTAAGGPSEIIRQGETGVLVPPEDPEAMANALRQLLNDPAQAAAMGKAARRDVQDRFSPERIAADLVAFCQKAIDARRT